MLLGMGGFGKVKDPFFHFGISQPPCLLAKPYCSKCNGFGEGMVQVPLVWKSEPPDLLTNPYCWKSLVVVIENTFPTVVGFRNRTAF